MQNKLTEKISEFVLLIISLLSATLWYFDIISEPVVAIISPLFGLFVSIVNIKILYGSKKNEENSILLKKKLDPKDKIIIALFVLLVIFILIGSKNEVTGIKGNNNHGNKIEIRD